MTSPSDHHRRLAVNNHDVPSPDQPFSHAHGVAGQSDNPFLVAQQPPELPHHNVIAAGSSATGSSATGSSAAGSSATGSSATGSSAAGSSAAGSSAAGSSAAGSSAAGSSAAGSSAAGSSAAGSSAAGSSATGRSVSGGSATGRSAAGGSAAALSPLQQPICRQRNTTAQPQAPTAQLAPVDQAIQPAIGSVTVAALHAQYSALPPLQQPAQPQPLILQSAPYPHHGHQPGNVPVQPQLPVQQNHPSALLHHDHPPINAVQQIQAQLPILQLVPPPQQQPPIIQWAPPQYHYLPGNPALQQQQQPILQWAPPQLHHRG
ncbi:hypothetical protein BU17DRAFT_93068 [Hysterangium stoloniferum]|nr:hypothetical protein BU17DRAFT_93068 [Hysterangium stoloniferum]